MNLKVAKILNMHAGIVLDAFMHIKFSYHLPKCK